MKDTHSKIMKDSGVLWGLRSRSMDEGTWGKSRLT